MQDFEKKIEIKNKIHEFINNNCLFRCDPNLNYSPSVEDGFLPTVGRGKTKSMFFLKRLTHNAMMNYYTSMLLLEAIINHYKSINEIPFFQLCGLETGSLPLITAIQQNALKYGLNINAFSIRKKRKPYGLFNFVEGIPTDAPVIIIDDNINSGASIFKCIEVCTYELNLEIVDQLYSIITLMENQSYQIKFDEKIFTVNSIFTKDEFDYEYDPEKYWLPKDCDRTINKRPEYF